MSSIMLPHKEVAQRLLQLARTKIEKETTAAEPRLLRLLVCANMADNACQSMREDGSRRKATEKERHGRQIMPAANNSISRRSLPALTRSRKDHCIPSTHQEQIKSIQTSTRPRASLCDRATFRKCIDHRDEQSVDNAVESDSESTDSGPTFSDDEDDEDDADGSDYSSEDDTECQLQRDLVKPTQRLASTTASYTYKRR
jgi:hypothetical protein